jgi:hypothetical protein
MMTVKELKENNIYIAGINLAPVWSSVEELYSQEDCNSNDDEKAYEEQQKKLRIARKNIVERVKNLFRQYLELDNVSFLFGTGSSIHLGAASIQNIPDAVEKEVTAEEGSDIANNFEFFVQQVQKVIRENKKEGESFTDTRGWQVTYDGTYVRDCGVPNDNDVKEIAIPLESFLNYLIAHLYCVQQESNGDEVKRLENLIKAIKKAMFNLCDLHERKTSDQDLKRIEDRGYKDVFLKDKYIFHERFVKSLLQRPLNLKRANIFTSNYDLAFEYAFDNIGVKYIDGFSGFHHRYFKPETYDYDIFYPGSTTAGKVQRIEKVVRYFKLHGSISWVKDQECEASNIYGIEEMPIDLIKAKAETNSDFSYGDLMIYPSAVKKSYTLDLPYSEIIRQFASAISQPQTVLFAVGYSFCDEHFNDIIYQALSNPSFTLIIINFNSSDNNKEIKRLRELKDPRIIILEGNYLGDFLTFATDLMPNFIDASSEENVVETLNNLFVPKK